MPVGSCHRVELWLAVAVKNRIAVFINQVFSFLFLSPCAVGIDRAHGRQNMKMRIGYPTVTLVRLMNGKIGDHTFTDKMLLHKLSCQLDILLHCQFVLQGDIEAVCKLSFLVPLRVLDRVPQCRSILILGRSVIWQKYFRINHAPFPCIVAVLAVVIAVELFAGAVGSRGNSALTGAPLDLLNAEMIERDLSHRP